MQKNSKNKYEDSLLSYIKFAIDLKSTKSKKYQKSKIELQIAKIWNPKLDSLSSPV